MATASVLILYTPSTFSRCVCDVEHAVVAIRRQLAFSLFMLLLACLGPWLSGPHCRAMVSLVRGFSFFLSDLCEFASWGGFECFMRCDVVILGCVPLKAC